MSSPLVPSFRPLGAGVAGVIDGELLLAAAALGRFSHAGMIHQDPAHDLGGDGEEMCAVPIVRLLRADHARIELVHQHGGLQGVPRPLAAEVAFGNPAELVIDDGNQAVERRFVAVRQAVDHMPARCVTQT